MTPVEKALREFASAIYRETMGRGRVVEVTIDAETYDRLASSAGGMAIYTALPGGRSERSMMLACNGGYVRVRREPPAGP